MLDLSSSTALITGAGKGLGRGIARAFASQGARLALVDLDSESLEVTATELAARTAVRTYSFDVRDRDAYAAAVGDVESQLGSINVLCNNAGLVFAEELAAMTYELWDLVLGVNLNGVVNGIQTVLPGMIQREEPAHIVNTSSIAGLGPGGGLMYTTSKYAVVGLSEALDEQLATAGLPIRVTALCPGAVSTDISATGQAAIETLSDQSAQAREFATDRADQAAKLLERHGIHPDAVGIQIIEAITTQARFVLTDRAAEQKIRKRTEDILASMPGTIDQHDDAIYRSATSLRTSRNHDAADPTMDRG